MPEPTDLQAALARLLAGTAGADELVALHAALGAGQLVVISGKPLASASDDTTLILWDFAPVPWRACLRDYRPQLYGAEWERCFLGAPYPATPAAATCPRGRSSRGQGAASGDALAAGAFSRQAVSACRPQAHSATGSGCAVFGRTVK